MLDDTIINQFRQIISTQTGLVIPEHDTPLLHEKLCQRLLKVRSLPEQGASEAERYLALLEANNQASETEWRELVLELTTGESYFFRDAGQMRLLREVILPELLRIKNNEQQLRIWSAGCSSGEEPYSLAVILQQLLPPASKWRILIKGTDINEYALQQARKARYNQWAFRGVDEDIVANYFLPIRDDWLLNSSVREMVTFEKFNLIKDVFPDSSRELCDMDLIVCRNVFIYFNTETIAGVMSRFAASLRPGGYILTGHAEVQYPVSKMVSSGTLPLLVRHFPDSVVFQRPIQQDVDQRVTVGRTMVTPAIAQSTLPAKPFSPAQSARPDAFTFDNKTISKHKTISESETNKTSKIGGSREKTAATEPPATDASAELTDNMLKEAGMLFERGQYGKAILLLEPLLDCARLVFDVSLLLAHIHANLGNIGQAETYCQEALRQRPFATAPHFLLASIVHERGDLEQYKNLLNKTIYLDRAHVSAYLHLAAIHQEEGSKPRARQMRLAALDVLHGLPATDRVEHYEEWTVAALVAELEKILADSTS